MSHPFSCFSPSVDDIERDKAIHKRMQHLQFVTADHLDISEKHRDNAKLDLAIEELRKIAQYKAPRDKVVCVLNCCKLIYGILNKASASGHPAGADDFLPLLIYVVLRANPPQMHSNLQYILKFRSASKMISEAGYYFTHLESTIDFIEHLDASKLTIDPRDFERLLSQAQQQTAARNQKAPTMQDSQKSVELERLPSIIEPQMTLTSSSGSGSSPSINTVGLSTDSLLMDFGDAFNSSAPAPFPSSAKVSPNPSGGGMAGSPDLLQMSKSSSTAVSRSDDRLSRQSSGSMQQFEFDDESSGPEKFLKVPDANRLLVGDLQLLLSSFKQLYYENQRMRAELAAAKFDVLKR
jgi:Rab5 GDP/GTP exchange factor